MSINIFWTPSKKFDKREDYYINTVQGPRNVIVKHFRLGNLKLINRFLELKRESDTFDMKIWQSMCNKIFDIYCCGIGTEMVINEIPDLSLTNPYITYGDRSFVPVSFGIIDPNFGCDLKLKVGKCLMVPRHKIVLFSLHSLKSFGYLNMF